MPTDEQMTLDERLEYLRKMKKRYATAAALKNTPRLCLMRRYATSDTGDCLGRRRTDANRRSKHHAEWSAKWTRGHA
jgi:hypothetical protein